MPATSHVTVELDCDAAFLTCSARYRGAPAGIAKFTIDAEQAELGDVEVYERAPHWWPPARWCGVKCNYQRHGIGTEMMRAALNYLRSIGVREVFGHLGGGDPDMQRAWYKRLGFQIAADTISKRL